MAHATTASAGITLAPRAWTTAQPQRRFRAVAQRVRVGGVPIDPLTMAQAIDAIEDMVCARCGGSVFTPNVDHIVQCQVDAQLRAAYEAVDLSLADGMPVVWASRLLHRTLPEKVSGSDLVTPLVRRAAHRRWRVLLLGGAEGIAQRAAARMSADNPGLHVVGTLSPSIDLHEGAAEHRRVLEAVSDADPESDPRRARSSQAGALDPRVTGGARSRGPSGDRRDARLHRRRGPPRPRLDVPQRPRVALPAHTGSSPAVEALPGPRPSLRRCAAPQSATVVEGVGGPAPRGRLSVAPLPTLSARPQASLPLPACPAVGPAVVTPG